MISNENLYSSSNGTKTRRDWNRTWTETKIERPSDNANKSKRCVITIPVYKKQLTELEADSLRQVVKILGDKYELVLFCPVSLDITPYNEVGGYNFSVLRCTDEFFKSQRSYSDLCERWEFYDAFSEFEYMIIYQLDAWIFEDKLDYFMDMGYDYIGAIHLVGFKNREGENGNGGFSLRKVKTFTDVCKKTDFSPYRALEDCVFTQALKHLFNLAPLKVCRQFSFQDTPSIFFKQNGNKLPMGCHAFRKFNWQFWKKYIIPEKYNNEPEQVTRYIAPRKIQGGELVSSVYGESAIEKIIARRKIKALEKSGPVRKFR